MRAKANRFNFLSETVWQSLIWTLVYTAIYVFVSFYSEAFPQDTVILGVLVFSTAVPYPLAAALCYLACLICVIIGKKITKRPLLGGHLGGIAGVLLNFTLLCGVVLLLLRKSP